MDATSILGVLGFLENGIHVIHGNVPLALIFLTSTKVYNGVIGGVQVAGTNEVTNVKGIDFAVTLEVVDLEGELDFCKNTKSPIG